MYATFLPFAVLMLLAGRALAFTITVGTTNFTTSDILAIPDSPVKTACQQSCTTASQNLQACNDDANCLCKAETVASLQGCEQCMFTYLINKNKPMPDFRAGSTPVLQAYSTACNATTGKLLAPESIALTLPSSWDGPYDSTLSIPVAVLYIGVGGFLGVSSLIMLSTM